MTQTARPIGTGEGWRASDVLCNGGPDDPREEERHDGVCLALVRSGSFRYRATHGTALLVPGTVLLGNHEGRFECGHDHGIGDRCLCFTLDAAFFEDIAAGVPGIRRAAFAAPRLSSLPVLAPLMAAIVVAVRRRDPLGMEDALVRLAALALHVQQDGGRTRQPSPREARAIAAAARHITDAHGAGDDASLSLATLARSARLSPFRFLRLFRQLVGTTPHQYLLAARLHHAATRLRLDDAPISVIAFEAGFGDLSSFNHRFRRIMGRRPSAYRAGPALLETGMKG